MSFASKVKDELALNDAEYERDELTALFKTAGNITISNKKMTINFKTENAKIAQKVFKKIHQLYDVKPLTSIYKSMKLKKNNFYCLCITEKVDYILKDLDLIELNNLKNISRSDRRIKSFLGGCFMGSGSVNDPKKTNYHLEMAFIDEVFAKEVLRLMEKIYLSPHLISRRNQIVVYLKKSQEIADFLAGIKATNCYFEFEDYRMERDYVNIGNRLNNCDIANSVRVNVAANEQIKNIEIIKKYSSLAFLEKDLEILSNLRLSNPEDSLKELAKKFNEITDKNITKSGINHLFNKIKTIANSYKNNE